MSKITRSAISQKPVNQKKEKKVHPSYIFLHLSAKFRLKIQNTNGRKLLSNLLDMCKIDT